MQVGPKQEALSPHKNIQTSLFSQSSMGTGTRLFFVDGAAVLAGADPHAHPDPRGRHARVAPWARALVRADRVDALCARMAPCVQRQRRAQNENLSGSVLGVSRLATHSVHHGVRCRSTRVVVCLRHLPRPMIPVLRSIVQEQQAGFRPPDTLGCTARTPLPSRHVHFYLYLYLYFRCAAYIMLEATFITNTLPLTAWGMAAASQPVGGQG